MTMKRLSASFCAVFILALTGCSATESSIADCAIARPVHASAASLTAGDDLGFSLKRSHAAYAAVQPAGE
jgi:hypothetical protein